MSAMNCTTLAQLAQKFDSVITNLKYRTLLCDLIEQGDCHALVQAVQRGGAELEVLLLLMKTELDKQKAALQSFKEMKKDVEDLHRRITHASNHIPSHLPTRPLPPSKPVCGSKNPVTPVAQRGRRGGGAGAQPPLYTPLLSGDTGCSASETGSDDTQTSPGGLPSVTQIKQKAPMLFLPTLEYLTMPEFNDVPKYQRGRLNYEQVNSAIDAFNTALTAKYKLLSTSRVKQNDRVRRQVLEYREQEGADTKGLFFITEKELKSGGKFRLDSAGRSILTILRHCNRIREVRSRGVVRFAAVI